jgi:hypothetical protein
LRRRSARILLAGLLRPWGKAHMQDSAEHNNLANYFLRVSNVIHGVLLGLAIAGL